MWRLIADFLRRRWPMYVLFAAGSTILFARVRLGQTSWPAAFVISVELALFATVMAFSIAPKEVRMLPISRRDFKRAGWWLIATGIAAVTAGKLLAALRPGAAPPLPMSRIALSTLFDLANSAAALGFVPMLILLALRPRSNILRALIAMVVVCHFLAFMGGAAWLLYWYDVLPTTWGALGGAGWLWAVAAVACAAPLAALAIARARRIDADPDGQVDIALLDRARDGRARNERLPSPGPFAGWPGAELTGFPRFVAMHWVRHTAGLILGLAALAFIALLMGQSSGRPESALQLLFLPFHYAKTVEEALVRLALPAIIVIPGTSNLLWAMRSLRALPLSTARLAWLPVLMSLLDWATLLAILLVIHVLSLGSLPPLMPLAPLLFFAAVSIISISLQWRWRQERLGLITIAILFPVFYVLDFVSLPVACGLSVLAIVLAGGFNYLTLMRSRAPYAPGKTFGARVPG